VEPDPVTARSRPMPADLLARIGFTDHAIDRFAGRAGLATSQRAVIEPLLRELVICEGRVVFERPGWARSRNHADLYVQVGAWLLLIACHDPRRPAGYSVVTVISRPEDRSWAQARRRGHVATAPPAGALSRPRLVALIAALLRRLLR
jgi:hypothetical protein